MNEKLSYQDLKGALSAALALEWRTSFDGDLDYQDPPVPVHSEAAVLIMINLFDVPSITLTERTASLRLHSGQVAFPGGKKDAEDTTLYDTATREAEEEIGLPKDHPLIQLGALSHHKTITGFAVTPYVVLNEKHFDYRPEAGEVAEVFELPFERVRTENFEIGSQNYRGQARHYFVLPYEGYFIWGATARILHQLAARLEHVG